MRVAFSLIITVEHLRSFYLAYFYPSHITAHHLPVLAPNMTSTVPFLVIKALVVQITQ